MPPATAAHISTPAQGPAGAGGPSLGGERSALPVGALSDGPATPAPLLRLTLPGAIASVRPALTQVMAALTPLTLTQDCSDATELVLAEVLNNIIEHAYAGCTGPIELELRLVGPVLACSVCDYGAPMPDGTPPPGREPLLDVPLADLPEGGFGWFLIRSLTRDLAYVRYAHGNRLSFAIPLERRRPPG